MSQPEDDAMRMQRRSKAVKEAWSRTNEEMKLVAEQRREDGWEAVSMPTVHTSPVSKSQGNDDRFGLVHVLPDNHAESFSDAFERGDFPQYEAYRNEIDGHVYLVTELIDPESETIILLASHYDFQLAKGMVTTALDEEILYTHVKTIDGTLLGSIEHDVFDPLVPGINRDEV